MLTIGQSYGSVFLICDDYWPSACITARIWRRRKSMKLYKNAKIGIKLGVGFGAAIILVLCMSVVLLAVAIHANLAHAAICSMAIWRPVTLSM